MKAIEYREKLCVTLLWKRCGRLLSGSTGKSRKDIFGAELTIASVKEKDIKPIAIDATLIGASAVMAFAGHQAMRNRTWGCGGGAIDRFDWRK
jgi:hypothetical protein